ncbi:MAG: hypothetical protein HYZ28_04585 [Myxococcales bacterium]|nr:hypothetical protein [Myxococcales bacterium]
MSALRAWPNLTIATLLLASGTASRGGGPAVESEELPQVECEEMERLLEQARELRLRIADLRARADRALQSGRPYPTAEGEALDEPREPAPAEERLGRQQRPSLMPDAAESIPSERADAPPADEELTELPAPVTPENRPGTDSGRAEVTVAPEHERRARPERPRTLREQQPLLVEDARASSGLEADLALVSGDGEGNDGLLLRPRLALGFPFALELGAEAELGFLEGEGQLGPVRLYALQEISSERRLLPRLALKAELAGPGRSVGTSFEATVLGTKTFGPTRLHLNLGYALRARTPDRLLLGLGADLGVGERLLLLADLHLRPQLGAGPAFAGADLGAGFRLSERLVLHGALGLSWTAGELDARALLGIGARP